MSMGWSDRRIAAPPLAQLGAVEVVCAPCGRGKRIECDELERLAEKGFERIEDLKGKLLCRGCGERHQLSLMPVFRRARTRDEFRAA